MTDQQQPVGRCGRQAVKFRISRIGEPGAWGASLYLWQLVSDHLFRQFGGRGASNLCRSDLLAETQHGNPIADFHHLFQLMANEDNGMSVRLETTEDGEQFRNLLWG